MTQPTNHQNPSAAADPLSQTAALLEGYHRWLQAETTLELIGQQVQVTMPYLDRHNDYLQVYMQPAETGWRLHDGSETLDDLAFNGIDTSAPAVQAKAAQIARGFGVTLTPDHELEIATDAESFPISLLFLFQAILAVNEIGRFPLPAGMVRSNQPGS